MIIPFPPQQERLTGTIQFESNSECECWIVDDTSFGELKDAIEYAQRFDNQEDKL